MFRQKVKISLLFIDELFTAKVRRVLALLKLSRQKTLGSRLAEDVNNVIAVVIDQPVLIEVSQENESEVFDKIFFIYLCF